LELITISIVTICINFIICTVISD